MLCPHISPRSALQPQQGKADQREQDVAPEDYAGIAWREIVGRDHLVDVAARRAQHEDAGADDRRESEVEASKCGEEADGGEAEAGRADLELKRAVGPSDEMRGQLPEETVENCVVEVQHADRPKYEPRHELLDYGRTAN